MAIGKPIYGPRNTYAKMEGVKRGESALRRPAPPFGDCADSGTWIVFEKSHRIPNGKKNKDGSPQYRQVKCLEKKNKNKMVIQHCALCDFGHETIEAYKKKRTALEASGLTKEKVDYKLTAEIERIQFLFGDYMQVNDGKWYFNAFTPEGDLRCMKLSHKHKVVLDSKIDELRNRKLNPLDPCSVEHGVMFKFAVSEGHASQVVHSVEPTSEQKEIPGYGVVEQIRTWPMTESQIKTLEEQGRDLLNLFTTITNEQMKLIIDSDFSADVVGAVFGAGKASEGADEEEPGETTGNNGAIATVKTMADMAEMQKAANERAADLQKSTPADVQKLAGEDEIAKLKAQLAALTAAQAATKVEKVEKAAPSTPQQMPDDEFFKLYGPKTST